MNELQVVVNQNVGKIEFNYEEIKAELQSLQRIRRILPKKKLRPFGK